VVENKVYTYVEQMPELPNGGGQGAIVAAIQKAVRYPPMALRNQVEGRIFASFTVNPQGDVTDVKVVKGLGSGLDEETIRAIKTLPKFRPGKQNGRAVSVSFTVPITYKIQ
jgi:protein TonB